jgi:hypothetical protein
MWSSARLGSRHRVTLRHRSLPRCRYLPAHSGTALVRASKTKPVHLQRSPKSVRGMRRAPMSERPFRIGASYATETCALPTSMHRGEVADPRMRAQRN